MKGNCILLTVGVLAGATAVATLVLLLGFDRTQQLVDVANKLSPTIAAIVGGYLVYDRYNRKRVGESHLDLAVSGEARALRPPGRFIWPSRLGAEHVSAEKVDLEYCDLTVATREDRLAEGALETLAESGME